MFEIPAADDPRLLVEIRVPVKGRRPMVLRLPRYDMIDELTYRPMWVALEAIDADENKDMTARDKTRAAVLAMLKPFVSDKDYAICETLALGQLTAIRDHWGTQSEIPLGEYVASVNSSAGNTEAPSATTSTAPAITAATSDAA